MVELQKQLASYGERVGAPGSGSRRASSQAAMRAAEAGRSAADQFEPPGGHGSDGEGDSDRSSSNGDLRAPVEHYDDLEPDEIVGLVDSLEDGDLGSLLEYERAHLERPRVISAIEGVLARRQTGPRR